MALVLGLGEKSLRVKSLRAFLALPDDMLAIGHVLRLRAHPMCRYLSSQVADYWKGDIEAALKPHPTIIIGTQNLTTPHMTA